MLVACFAVLLGGAIFDSSYFPVGSAGEWAVTAFVLAAIASSACLFVWMLASELRRGLRAAALREVAVALAAAHAPRRAAPAASAVAAAAPRLSRVELLGWSSNPLHAARGAAAGGAAALARRAYPPRAAAAVVRLQAAARRRRALREAQSLAAGVYLRVLDDTAAAAGAPRYYFYNPRTGTATWSVPAFLRAPEDAAVYT